MRVSVRESRVRARVREPRLGFGSGGSGVRAASPKTAGISFLRWPTMHMCALARRTRLTSSFTLRMAAFFGMFFRSVSRSRISAWLGLGLGVGGRGRVGDGVRDRVAGTRHSSMGARDRG